jgi:hypothetical protein
MSSPAFDRKSLRFGARRVPQGIQLSAWFDAPKLSTGEPGSYMLQMTIDPTTRALKHPHFSERRAGAGYLAMRGSGLDELRSFAREVRDLFLKSPAWEALKDRGPDPDYSIDHLGKITSKSK